MEEFKIILVNKNENEDSIPTEWRVTIKEIVDSLASGGYKHGNMPNGVSPLEDKVINHISSYIQSYGCTLAPLPDETWETSIYIWQGVHWELLVDLFTTEEGRSDMVLSMRVTEISESYNFEVHMVYVP